jgi:elongation factor G
MLRRTRVNVDQHHSAGANIVTVPDKVRSFTLLGAPGSGKTALAEALLFRAKVLPQIEGGKTLDTEPEEIKRRSSVFAKIQSLVWEGHEISFADTPGGVDFVGAAVAPLAVLDAAVLVVDATTGVDVPTRQFYEMAIAHNKPLVIFVNKLDREGADFQRAVGSIRKTLTKKAQIVALPIVAGGVVEGAVDVIENKAVSFADKPKDIVVPDDMKDEITLAQQALWEEVAGTDDTLFEKLAGGEELSKDEVLPQLVKAIAIGEIVPIVGGTAVPPRGASLLLDVVCQLLPSPDKLPAFTVAEDGTKTPLTLGVDQPVSCQVFRVTSDPGVGELYFLRVYNGTVRSGDDLLNPREKDRERIGHMVRLQGKDKKELTEATIGQVVAVPKLKHTFAGDTLCQANRPALMAPIPFPNPVHSVTVQPETRKDQDKLGVALGKLAQTDPTLHHHVDAEFNEIILSGMGEVHLEIIAGRLRERYGIQLTMGLPHVAYRETLTKKVKAQGRHKKQTGGHGQFGDVWITAEPLPLGSGFEFVDEIKGGVVPSKFIPSVETGIRDTMKRGGLVGYPVVDLRVTIIDGSYHAVDSSDMAFQMAGAIAFRKCLELSGTTLLEPIMRLRITVLADYVGAVTSDLNSRRGRILGMDAIGDVQTVHAEIPLAEVFRYSTDLRSMTQGAGTFTMEFARYDPVPAALVEPIRVKQAERRKTTETASA